MNFPYYQCFVCRIYCSMLNLHLWTIWHRSAYIEVFHILILFIRPNLVSVPAEGYKVVKIIGDLNAPPEAIRSRPQLEILSGMDWCATVTVYSDLILMCIRSVSSTNNRADICPVRLDIGHTKWPPCTLLLCAHITVILITAHPAGAAQLPWQSPWNLSSIVLPENFWSSPWSSWVNDNIF